MNIVFLDFGVLKFLQRARGFQVHTSVQLNGETRLLTPKEFNNKFVV